MSWAAIRAVLRQEIYITRASWEIIFDVVFFSLSSIVLFGFIAKSLAGEGNNSQAQGLLIAIIFWEVLRINQYSTSISSMWNVWSHNLSNMFIAPIRISEYLVAHIIAATVKSVVMFVCAIGLAQFVFQLNILQLGLWPIAFSYLNMVIFATALGLVLIGLVFQYGTKVQALTWGTVYFVQPLCAVFFPVSVLPALLQPIAYLFPVTFFFEWLRAIHQHAAYSSTRLLWAFIFNLVWLGLACYVFSLQLAAAKRSGQLVRTDL